MGGRIVYLGGHRSRGVAFPSSQTHVFLSELEIDQFGDGFENFSRLEIATGQKYSCEVDEEKSGNVDVVVE